MATAIHETHDSLTTPFLILAERNRAVLEKMARITQEETLHTLNQNLERNVRALERLRDCHGLSGVVEIHNEWVTGVMRDSIDQTQRMAKLWWRFAEDEAQSQSEAVSQSVQAARTRTERKPERSHNSEEKRAA